MFQILSKKIFLKRSLNYTKLYNGVHTDASKEYLNKIRNIGILAHIDAGKTTTTERMLYYSGLIKQMGEVHHGNTVTDYMEQERERGITIRSAAVTFNWKKHKFNLIDTPGHIDFTMEVEQTLNVLDGAIILLDASAGIEAQTLTVWRQADKYKIPRIVFINKMDRLDANLTMCCESIENKFEKPAICLHLPLIEKGKFIGLVDLLLCKKFVWNMLPKGGFVETAIEEKNEPSLWEATMKARRKLIDKLSESSDDLANIIISLNSLDDVKVSDIVASLRKETLTQQVVPVVCGSAYKNIGVETLMDAVVLYLPSPKERNLHFQAFEDNLCAKAFKVVHDKQKGPLVFSRIYSGQITKGQRIYNIQKEQNEQIVRLYIAYADEFQEVESIDNGNIAVIGGLKRTVTGDLITNSSSTAQKAKKKMKDLLMPVREGSVVKENNIETLFDVSAKAPEPVFFCSIEPPSLAYQAQLEQALIELQREDPSLRVTYNAETGQTVLAGMGELHLEIIKDRIKKEYKINVDLGPLQIAYREAPCRKVTTNFAMENKVGNSKHNVNVTLSLIPTEGKEGSDILQLDKTPEAASNLANIFPKHLLAVKRGVEVAFNHGPKLAAPVIDAEVMLHRIEIGRGTSETMITAAVTQCLQKLLSESGSTILEPIMNLEIVIPEDYVSAVLADLGRRRSAIQNILLRGNNKVVYCETPLADLLGYSTALRTLTSGTATFTMEFSHYQRMSSLDENKTIERVHGF